MGFIKKFKQKLDYLQISFAPFFPGIYIYFLKNVGNFNGNFSFLCDYRKLVAV